MKQLLFTFLFVALFQLTASAQYEYGTYYIDANLKLNLLNEKNDNSAATASKNNAFDINPEIGYFIQNNLAIGIGLNYKNTLNSLTNTPFIVYNSTGHIDYSLSPIITNELNEIAPVFFIKYFYQPTKKLSLSLKASYSQGWGTYHLIQKYIKNPQGIETMILDEKDKTMSKYIFLSPELQYLITKKLGFQINFNGLGYTSTTKYDNDKFYLNSYNPSLITGSTTKNNYESTSLNFNPSTWRFGVFFLLN